jgi:hypothetical protein
MEDLDVLYNGAQARPTLWFVSRSISSVTIHPNGWTPFLDRFSQWHSHIHFIYVCKEMSNYLKAKHLAKPNTDEVSLFREYCARYNFMKYYRQLCREISI